MYIFTELQDIPQPHSEKYAYLHNSSPENDQPKTREKNRVAFRDDRRNVAPDERNIDYDDYHPFRTNGNFTPNPAAHARQNQNYQSSDRIAGEILTCSIDHLRGLGRWDIILENGGRLE